MDNQSNWKSRSIFSELNWLRDGAIVFLVCGSLTWVPRAEGQTYQAIVNGGFETGDFTGWTAPANVANPWSVATTEVDDGQYSAFNPALSTAIGATELYQTFAPVPIADIVSAGFWFYDAPQYPDFTLPYYAVAVGVTGAGLLEFMEPTSVNHWTYFNLMPQLENYPNGSLNEIGFFAGVFQNDYIDDVSVIATVPEPSSLLLIPLGLGCLGFCRKKVILKVPSQTLSSPAVVNLNNNPRAGQPWP